MGKNPGSVDSGGGGGGGSGGSSGGWLALADPGSPRPVLVAPEVPAPAALGPFAPWRELPPVLASPGWDTSIAVPFDSPGDLDQPAPPCGVPPDLSVLAVVKAALPPVLPAGGAAEASLLPEEGIRPCGVPGSWEAHAQGHARAHARNTPDTHAHGPPRLVVVTATWCGPAPPSPAASARCAMLLPDMRGDGRAPLPSELRSTWWMMLASAAASPSAAARGRGTGHGGTQSRNIAPNRKRPHQGGTSHAEGTLHTQAGLHACRQPPPRARPRAQPSGQGGAWRALPGCYDCQQRPRSAAKCRRQPARRHDAVANATAAPWAPIPAWRGGQAARWGWKLRLKRRVLSHASGPCVQGCLTHQQPRAIWRRVCHCARESAATWPSTAHGPSGSRGARASWRARRRGRAASRGTLSRHHLLCRARQSPHSSDVLGTTDSEAPDTCLEPDQHGPVPRHLPRSRRCHAQ